MAAATVFKRLRSQFLGPSETASVLIATTMGQARRTPICSKILVANLSYASPPLALERKLKKYGTA
jgi:hypothetical protein